MLANHRSSECGSAQPLAWRTEVSSVLRWGNLNPALRQEFAAIAVTEQARHADAEQEEAVRFGHRAAAATTTAATTTTTAATLRRGDQAYDPITLRQEN